MLDSLYIAATGMQSQQTQVETIANNLANVNTQGFKKGRVIFTDLFSREAQRQSAIMLDAGAGVIGPTQRLGAGVGIASLNRMFDLGDIKKTESPFDIAINGDGFIEITLSDGARAYARGGTLKVNGDGLLADLAGHPLKPALSISDDAQNLAILSDGRVQVRLPNQNNAVEIGRIDLVRFTNPGALVSLGDNLYRASDASGEPIIARTGEDGVGTIQQGFLESSNVKLVEEMINLMVAQRAYEASVKVAQASDEMLGMVNSLRK
jgi:flagellar basal-body rod protein FlgG